MSRESPKRTAIEPASDLFIENRATPPRRPSVVVGGAALLAARCIGALLWALALFAQRHEIARDFDLTRMETTVLVAVLIGVSATWAVLLLLFAWLVWRGSNFARMVVMFGTAMSITFEAISYFSGDQEITVRTTLLTLALDILILLALSSRDARAWARKPVLTPPREQRPFLGDHNRIDT